MSESYMLGGVVSNQPKMRSVNSVAPLVGADHVFEIPAKLIKTQADMKIWEKSEAYFEYLGFILAINEAIKGKSNSRGSEKPSTSVNNVVTLLDKLDAKIDETPAIQQPQRFGNIAFRSWFQKMRDESMILLQDTITPELYKAIPEIATYLVDSFGNSTRIDYGTGHEMSFIMFLCCLFKIGFLKDTDKVAAGCKIFPRYLDLARKLQKTYRMEPAGSHGVWSLDDYQFVPFIWGSSQLFANPHIEPPGFLVPQILNQFGEDYMFLTCIKYINSVKTGPFAEHSNQLWSISGVSSWSKINGGLIKMYKAEVLSKFPVVQHIVFGSLFTLKPMEQVTGLMSAKTSMVPPPVPFPRATPDSGNNKGSNDSSLQSAEVKSSSTSESLAKDSSGSAVTKTSTPGSESRRSKQSDRKESSDSAANDSINDEGRRSVRSGVSEHRPSGQDDDAGGEQEDVKSSQSENESIPSRGEKGLLRTSFQVKGRPE